MSDYFDKIIIGAGLYGLYAADFCSKINENVLVLEYDEAPFMRATYINQARVHMGYHYPRSYTTAIKSAGYYDRFNKDYAFSINDAFDKIYAVSKNFSWTNAKQFEKFCRDSGIPCKPLNTGDYFKEDIIEGTFLSRECSYDAKILQEHLQNEIYAAGKAEFVFNSRIKKIASGEGLYEIELEGGRIVKAPFVLNSTYASVNQILNKTLFEKIDIKYELCEIILCRVNEEFKNTGITVMDGPFFSLMPFGKTGLHSLTAVAYTPHKTSYEALPTFECQQRRTNNNCNPQELANCNTCDARPKTSWDYMSNLAGKYLKDDIKLEYVKSLFSIKPILKSTEIDDARPTVIRQHSAKPTFVSVLSGKINTVYDLNQILTDGNN